MYVLKGTQRIPIHQRPIQISKKKEIKKRIYHNRWTLCILVLVILLGCYMMTSTNILLN